MGRAYEVRKASMAKTAAAKTKVYAKFGKEIYLAAKQGDSNPEMNVSLKRWIDKAKKEQVPADIIKRALEKATSGGGEDYTAVTYEGFGPGASTLIVECLTDNVNRSVSEVRAAFTKNKSKLGISGSVSHGYERMAIVSFSGWNEEEVLEALMVQDVDILNIEQEDDHIVVYGQPQDHDAIKSALLDAKKDTVWDLDEVTYLASESITLVGEERDYFERLLRMLDEVDDVQNVYHNVQL